MPDFKNCKKVFYDELALYVHREVYEPAEDSFAIAKHIPTFAEGDVLDMGTGCGILALVARAEEADVVGADISPIAVENAKFNAERNGMECMFVQSDLFNEVDGEFDLILFNPPYLPTAPEDRMPGMLDKAFNGGSEGREVIDRFIDDAPEYLREGGTILMLASSLSGIKATMDALKKKKLKVNALEEVPMFQEKLALLCARKV